MSQGRKTLKKKGGKEEGQNHYRDEQLPENSDAKTEQSARKKSEE